MLLLFAVGSAQAATPLVPRSNQSKVKDLVAQFGTPELAYVPTAAPKYFRLANFGVSRTVLTYTLADSRYATASTQERAVFFFFKRYRGSLAQCRKAKNGVVHLGTMKVYFQGFSAWRCVLAPNGKLVQLRAESSIVRDGALALMVSA
jgi:hypothetical protein